MVNNLFQVYHNTLSLLLLILTSILWRAFGAVIGDDTFARPHRDSQLRIIAFVVRGTAYNNV